MCLSYKEASVYIAEMELDLQGYVKCTENVKVPDKRAGPLSEHGSTQGNQEESWRITS